MLFMRCAYESQVLLSESTVSNLILNHQGWPVDPLPLPWLEDHQHPGQRPPHPRPDHHQPLRHKAAARKPTAWAFSQGPGVLRCSINTSKIGIHCMESQTSNKTKNFLLLKLLCASGLRALLPCLHLIRTVINYHIWVGDFKIMSTYNDISIPLLQLYIFGLVCS